MCLNIQVLHAEAHTYKYVGVTDSDGAADVLLDEIH